MFTPAHAQDSAPKLSAVRPGLPQDSRTRLKLSAWTMLIVIWNRKPKFVQNLASIPKCLDGCRCTSVQSAMQQHFTILDDRGAIFQSSMNMTSSSFSFLNPASIAHVHKFRVFKVKPIT
jgi:hypothetical protein